MCACNESYILSCTVGPVIQLVKNRFFVCAKVTYVPSRHKTGMNYLVKLPLYAK